MKAGWKSNGVEQQQTAEGIKIRRVPIKKPSKAAGMPLNQIIHDSWKD